MFLPAHIAVSFWWSIWAWLKYFDQSLFIKINSSWTNNFLDNVYPWWREANAWIPLYLFLFLFGVMNFGWRIWSWIVFFILTVILTDQISSTFFKDWIHRPRPCNDPAFMYQVRLLLTRCPTSGSFTSSHATNHFGAAYYVFFTMRPYFKKWGYLLFFWAGTISYGQVYVGVHYPLDIIGGAILGSCIGMMTAYIYKKRVGLPALLGEKNLVRS
jgi:membrane-associated phospholipid phosphatase